MRLSVERLRWGVLASALLLMAVLAVLLGYGRYRAVKMWKRIVAHSGVTITHETNGVTWSQAVKGRTVFTVHAAKAVPHGDGEYILHDAWLLLYAPDGKSADRLSGSEFDYNEKTGVAKALGEVDMDLQPPKVLSAKQLKGERQTEAAAHEQSEPAAGEKEAQPAPTIHVKTSGLVYLRKLGVAATDQEVEIEYNGLHGYARGAEFDSGHSVVHLLNDVRVNGVLRGQSGTLTAAKADLDRQSNVITLYMPVLHSGDRTASAQGAVLHLRPDGSVEHVHASGGVVLREGTRRIEGPQLEAAMSKASVLERAEFVRGAAMDDSDPNRPIHMAAGLVTVACDSAGAPASAVAQGAVTGSMEVRAPGAAPLKRQMAADRVMFTMGRVKGSHVAEVSEIDATGSAWMRGESVAAGAARAQKSAAVKTTEVAADDLKLLMAPDARGKDWPKMLTGAGHTRLEQTAADVATSQRAAQESSTGDALVVHFAGGPSAETVAAQSKAAAGGVEIASAEQTGHVSLRSVPAVAPAAKQTPEVTTGSAQRAMYFGGLNELTLYGRPEIERADGRISADTITLAESSGDATAQGNVEATFVSAGASPDAPVTHARSASAVLDRAEQTVEFRGTDAQPARLWQGASQLEAASIVLDHAHDGLMARPASAGGLVHTVFASALAAPAGTSTESGRAQGTSNKQTVRVVRIASGRLDYSGAARQAMFSGGVHAQGEIGDARSARGVVFLNAASRKSGPAARARPATQGASEAGLLGGSVEKIVLSGAVHFEEPGRHGTGEQMLYTASTGEFVLTGAPGRPPRVVDESQGSITGATLVFNAANQTVVVAGEPGQHQKPSRVHAETQVRP